MLKRYSVFITLALGCITMYSMNTGRYVIGSVAMILNGLLGVAVGPKRWNRVLGVAVMALGLYILARALGFLGVTAITMRQLALYAGIALMVVGLQFVRNGHRRKALFVATLGALLVTYGLGYIG